MSRKRKRSGEHFARLPRRVLESPACTTLPHAVFRLLVAYAAQYVGGNNGSLGLTRDQAKAFGIGHDTLQRGQRMLEDRGLIRMTRRGMRTPPVPHLYALTWEGIDPGKHDVQSNPVPSRDFAKWTPEKSFFDDRPAVTAVTDQQSRDAVREAPAVTDQQSRSADSDDRPAVTSKISAIGKGRSQQARGDLVDFTADELVIHSMLETAT